MNPNSQDEMKIYLWRVTNEYGEIKAEGVTTEFVDFFLDNLPGIYTTADRNLDKIQKFLDENYPAFNYRFEYKEEKVEW